MFRSTVKQNVVLVERTVRGIRSNREVFVVVER